MTDLTIPATDQVFNYAIQPKPTVYEGQLFRSNLEATWAAFFDNMGWRREYEPIVLDGWVPDFRLTHWGSDVWCEVKPMTRGVHLPTCEKMRRAMPAGFLLFLGAGLKPAEPVIDPGARRAVVKQIRLGWYHDEYSEWSPICTSDMSADRRSGPLGAWDAAAKATRIKGRYW